MNQEKTGELFERTREYLLNHMEVLEDGTLPPACSIYMDYRYIKKKPVQGIAEFFHVSESVVTCALRLGRKKLGIV